MAFELAVYASPNGSPHPAQDSLPGAGQALLDGLAYPQGSFERFQSSILHLIPLPQAWLGANLIGAQLFAGPGKTLTSYLVQRGQPCRQHAVGVLSLQQQTRFQCSIPANYITEREATHASSISAAG